jgi:hypothetical protein
MCFAQGWGRQPHLAKRLAALRICLELGYKCDSQIADADLFRDTYFTVSPHCGRPRPPTSAHPLGQRPLPPLTAPAHPLPARVVGGVRSSALICREQPSRPRAPRAQPRSEQQRQFTGVRNATTPSCVDFACLWLRYAWGLCFFNIYQSHSAVNILYPALDILTSTLP